MNDCPPVRLSVLQAQIEAQQATQEFQRAVEILRAAKETIALAEERLLEEDTRQFDSAWQEMLNHATQRVRRTRRRTAKERKPALQSPPLWMSAGDGGGASQNPQ